MPVVDNKSFSSAPADDAVDVDTVAGFPPEVAPYAPDFGESRFVSAPAANSDDEWLSMPLLGKRHLYSHQRILGGTLVAALLVFGVTGGYAFWRSNNVAQQLGDVGTSLMQSQRLAKSVSQALVGSLVAFPDVAESAAALATEVHDFEFGADDVAPMDAALQPDVAKIKVLVERATKNAATVMGQQKVLTQVGSALRTINRQSSDLLEIAETVASFKLQQAASLTQQPRPAA